MKILRVLLIATAVIAVLLFAVSYYAKRETLRLYHKSLSNAPYDAIIVPGIPYDVPEPNTMLKVRMYWARKLFNEGIARNIIFSGAAVHTSFVEGKYMKTYADSMGIPQNRTFVESRALHGDENIRYGLRLAKKLRFTKVAVATDPFQTLFLRRSLTKEDYEVSFLPFPIDSMPVFNQPLPRINPRDAYVPNFVPLKDR